MSAKVKTKPKIHHINGLVVWGVPQQLRLDFKAACARQNTSMRAEIMRFMGAYSERKK